MKKKIIKLLILIIVILFIKNEVINNKFNTINEIFSKIIDNKEYEIIKQDKNENYSGIGHKKQEGKDGYYTTFTIIEDNQKTYIEYK